MNENFTLGMNDYFKEKLLFWNSNFNKRAMPWKNEKSPYKVWISEIILQQTRVEQGLNYYLKFINKFPTIKSLANASEDEVLILWQGLGYYSRARNMHYTAKYIVDELNGIFPNTYKEIIKLKGVGEYTAAAISSFCFNENKAVVDGNVKRVLSRFFYVEQAIDTTEGKKIFNQLSEELLPINNSAAFNQAIMDFGATVCKPKKPLCNVCILQKKCKALKEDKIELLPFKVKKIEPKNRYFYSFLIKTPKGFIVEQREENDIWKKLYQLPMIEFLNKTIQEQSNLNNLILNKFQLSNYTITEISKEFTQKLTHQYIHIQFINIETTENILTNKEKLRYTRKLTNFAFPKIFILYLQSKNLILE